MRRSILSLVVAGHMLPTLYQMPIRYAWYECVLQAIEPPTFKLLTEYDDNGNVTVIFAYGPDVYGRYDPYRMCYNQPSPIRTHLERIAGADATDKHYLRASKGRGRRYR